MSLRQLSIGGRLAAAFALTCLLVLITGAAGLMMMRNMNDNTEEIAGNWLPSVQVLAQIDSTVNTDRRVLMRHILEVDASSKLFQAAAPTEIRTKTLPDLLTRLDHRKPIQLPRSLGTWASLLHDKVCTSLLISLLI